MMAFTANLSLSALAGLLALTACSSSYYPGPPVGAGWSRAPDLSVYVALNQAGQLAREQEILCLGRNPALVDDRWRGEFGARHEWIEAALAARHGAEVLAASERRLIGREPCPEIINDRWERHYSRLLRLLELRLYPRESWSSG
jgi:hypothetical protein